MFKLVVREASTVHRVLVIGVIVHSINEIIITLNRNSKLKDLIRSKQTYKRYTRIEYVKECVYNTGSTMYKYE